MQPRAATEPSKFARKAHGIKALIHAGFTPQFSASEGENEEAPDQVAPKSEKEGATDQRGPSKFARKAHGIKALIHAGFTPQFSEEDYGPVPRRTHDPKAIRKLRREQTKLERKKEAESAYLGGEVFYSAKNVKYSAQDE